MPNAKLGKAGGNRASNSINRRKMRRANRTSKSKNTADACGEQDRGRKDSACKQSVDGSLLLDWARRRMRFEGMPGTGCKGARLSRQEIRQRNVPTQFAEPHRIRRCALGGFASGHGA